MANVADRLMELVSTDPRRALSDAHRHRSTVGESDPAGLARLQRVIAIAQQDLGELDEAESMFRTAIDLAGEAGDEPLRGALQSSLAFLVAKFGRLEESIQLFEQAESVVTGLERARLLNHRGVVHYWRGELVKAAATLEAACDALAPYDNQSAVKSRINLGAVLAQLGRFEEAEKHLRRVVTTNPAIDAGPDLAAAHQNLAFLARLRGDLPVALAELAVAEAGYVAAGDAVDLPGVYADHADTLANAGLFDDADRLLQTALAHFEEQGQGVQVAGCLLRQSDIRLARGDPEGARHSAIDAARRFRQQRRPAWASLATAIRLQAEARRPRIAPSLPDRLTELAEKLAPEGWMVEATRSRLIAAKLLADRGATGSAVVTPAIRGAVKLARPADRILLAHVDAIVAANRGDRAAARRAVTRGLGVAMSAQAALGSIETRAHAAIHGYGLAEVGARLAIADRRPRELLARIEATRLMTSRLPAVRPPDDPELARLLTELRSVNATIADAASTAEQRAEAEQSRLRVEREIRQRSRAARGDGDAVGVAHEMDAAIALLGDRQLLAHAALDGRLYAVSVVDGRARLHELGDLGGVDEHVESIAFSLHRLNRRQGSEESRLAAAELLYEIAAELSELLLPPIVADSFEPVVIVPTARLHDVPWGLLPPLGGRAVSVAPSVSAWAAAERTRRQRAAKRRRKRRIGFLAGPGLEYAEFEVENLSAHYGDATVLTGAEASVDACLDLLGRADLVHAACHGSFRIDNPMFSSLELADGPLIVHDLERLRRMPATVVLSACSVAGAKVLQGGSLLGLASALITLGACSVIAPLTPISDAAAVTVMDRLHQQLLAGETPAAALAHATMAHDVTDPTAAAFVALGA